MGGMKEVALIMEQCNVTEKQAIKMLMEDRRKAMDDVLHRQQQRDYYDMQEVQDAERDAAFKELEIALIDLKSWQETRKYSSTLIDSAMYRIGTVLDKMRDGKLWGNPHVL